MSTAQLPNEQTQDKALLAKALLNAGKAFGFNQTELADINEQEPYRLGAGRH